MNRWILLHGLMLVVLFGISLSDAHANTLIVDTTADTPKPGRLTLREAISQAKARDTICFDAGLNDQTIILTSGTLRIDKDLTVTAQSLGIGVTIQAGRQPGSMISITQPVGGQEPHVMFAKLTLTGARQGYACTSNLSHLSIHDCRVVDNVGGGISTGGGSLNVEQTIIDGNNVGISCQRTGLTVSHSTISENYRGPGILIQGNDRSFSISDTLITRNFGGIRIQAPGTMLKCEIANNQDDGIEVRDDVHVLIDTCQISRNGSLARSGIAHNGTGTVHMVNCLITQNGRAIRNGLASMKGGIMALERCRVTDSSEGSITNYAGMTIDHCTISKNRAMFSTGGGGIHNEGNLYVQFSTIANNFARQAGGGVLCTGNSRTRILSSTISGNTTSFIGNTDGGGIYVTDAAQLRLDNCTVSENRAGIGAGIYVATGTSTRDLNISSCTITANVNLHGTNRGAGIYLGLQPALRANIHNSIIAANVGALDAPDIDGSVVSLGHNLIGNMGGSAGWVSTDITGDEADPVNPRLGSLEENGGPTRTHALLKDSPALNQGDPNLAGTSDQRGVKRDSSPDIGSFEAT